MPYRTLAQSHAGYYLLLESAPGGLVVNDATFHVSASFDTRRLGDGAADFNPLIQPTQVWFLCWAIGVVAVGVPTDPVNFNLQLSIFAGSSIPPAAGAHLAQTVYLPVHHRVRNAYQGELKVMGSGGLITLGNNTGVPVTIDWSIYARGI